MILTYLPAMQVNHSYIGDSRESPEVCHSARNLFIVLLMRRQLGRKAFEQPAVVRA